MVTPFTSLRSEIFVKEIAPSFPIAPLLRPKVAVCNFDLFLSNRQCWGTIGLVRTIL